MFVCMYVCIVFVRAYMHAYMSVCLYVCIVFVRACVHVCMSVCLSVCMYCVYERNQHILILIISASEILTGEIQQHL